MTDKIEGQKLNLEENKKMKEKYIKQLNELTQKTEKIKKEWLSLKNSLSMHYHRLLSEGKDTRREGLSWLIRSIWDLGEIVTLSYLPSFLDEETIGFLFKVLNL